jgi:tetratricopeptide (TPR) repeat protein
MEVSARVSESILGKDNAETAQYINDFGFFVGELGDKKRAKSLYLEAYRIRRRILNDDHFSIAESLNNLATLDVEKRALPKLQKALEIRRKSLGSAHPDTLNSIRNVASTLDLLGRNTEAKSLLLEAISICKDTYGDSSAELADTLTYYSIYLWHNGLVSDAQRYAKQSLDIKERVFGPKNPGLVINLIGISEACSLAGHHIEAKSNLQRAIDISIMFYGANHELTNHIRDKICFIEKEVDEDTQDNSSQVMNKETVH